MPFLYLITQLALVVCWYNVPAMATLPAVVVFIPTIAVGIGILLWVALMWFIFSKLN